MSDGPFHLSSNSFEPGFGTGNESKPWNWMLFPFSSIKADVENIYAASIGHGVYGIDAGGVWSKLDAGLDDQTTVNKLQLYSGILTACTSSGLYTYSGGEWSQDGLAVPCYQYLELGKAGYAATEYGLWCRVGSKWEQIAMPDRKVYNFINLPQYIVAGHTSGISMYDRYMDDWAHFELGRAVTGLSVYRGRIVAATDQGELLVGDTRGRFDRISFGKMFVFNVCTLGRTVFACTDRGLFRLANIRNQLALLPVKTGLPVTDVDMTGGSLYMATLFQGVHAMEM
ncbi:hypothetical protein [Paenibacillus protaetiae]|uniref:Uncharacterized protein n=1 Tax=Paenibacillus protaetiae TaxID=2509456 RepID=A0A4V0YFB6_9BACL|nr:hypothetical protein [Paenibacillus protaetiae]QAY67141.1 hypothetical protein ET464_12780 [Paenibacillus protaetiae]